MPNDRIVTLRALYERFNARDLDGVLMHLTDNVRWANGMDGGYVNGTADVRDYWTRQWSMVSPRVEPLAFQEQADGSILVEVWQTVFDLQGRSLEGQSHGLVDKTVGHLFRFRGPKIAVFEITDAAVVP